MRLVFKCGMLKSSLPSVLLCVMFALGLSHFSLLAQELNDVYDNFATAYANLNADLVSKQYAEAAHLINLYEADSPTSFHGRHEIHEFFAHQFALVEKENKSVDINFIITNREQKKDWVIDNGYYRLTISDDAGVVADRYGKLSTVLIQENNAWKFSVDANATARESEYLQAQQLSLESNSSTTLDEQSIRTLNQNYLLHWLANNEDDVLELFHPDARISPSGMAPIRGWEEIRQFWFPEDGSQTIIHAFTADEMCLQVDDSIAFATQKTFLDFTYQKDSLELSRIQKAIDMSIYKKRHGIWKVWRKSWTDLEMVNKKP